MSQQTFNEINDARPQVLEHFTGQQSVVSRIRVTSEAAWNDGTRCPHMLFTGPPGLGKSELYRLVALEMGSEIREQLAQNLNSKEALNGFLLISSDKDVLLIDEIHELQPTIQTLLYRSMENG